MSHRDIQALVVSLVLVVSVWPSSHTQPLPIKRTKRSNVKWDWLAQINSEQHSLKGSGDSSTKMLTNGKSRRQMRQMRARTLKRKSLSLEDNSVCNKYISLSFAQGSSHPLGSCLYLLISWDFVRELNNRLGVKSHTHANNAHAIEAAVWNREEGEYHLGSTLT